MQAMARGEFLFTDENIFNIEEVFNQQIDWVYASTSRETHDKDPERPSSCFSHVLVGECHMMPPPSSISVKRGWNPLPKSMRTPCWSLLWSFLTTLCSVMNIGALSRIWHLPARQTLPRSGSGRFSGLNYSGWFRVYWPFSSSDLSPMDSKSGQCLKARSVRIGTPISKSWSAPWWKQWWISQRKHCVIQ